MNCPKCAKKMVAKRRDTSVGKKDAKYARTVWVCKKCDVWVTVEVPKKGRKEREEV